MLNREKQLMLDLLIEKYGTKDQQNVEVWQQLSNQTGPAENWLDHPTVKNLSEDVKRENKQNKSAVKPVEPRKTRKRILSVSRRHWKTEDLQTLVELSANYSVEQIAVIMKRTKPAIYRMQGNLRWGHCDSRLVHQFRVGKDFSKLGNSQYQV